MRRGIPNITLDGSKDDWQKILQRINRLYELGDEPSVWATMLRPILRRFVSAFDGEVDVHFWEHLVYLPFDPFEMLVVNGWITAFCVWNFFGKWQGGPLPEKIPRSSSRLKVDAKRGVVGARLKKLFRIGPASSSDGSAGDTEREDGQQVDGPTRGSVVEQGGESSIQTCSRTVPSIAGFQWGIGGLCIPSMAYPISTSNVESSLTTFATSMSRLWTRVRRSPVR